MDIPAHLRHALELRYDGPIPTQYLDCDRAKQRRQRGVLSVLETQVARFLDAAERCQGDTEDIAADLAERSLARWQREVGEQLLQTLLERRDDHIRAAAEALGQAILLRCELGLAPHPIVSLIALMGEPQKEVP